VSSAAPSDAGHFHPVIGLLVVRLSYWQRWWQYRREWRMRKGGLMDPVSLIIMALAAGAGLGLKGAASSAVTDAYQGLKALVERKLADRKDGELVLARHEQSPEIWDKPLAAELTAAGAGVDTDLVAAAQALMQLLDAAGSAAGKYQVVVHGSQGVQIGERNTQHNTFAQPPGR
jgi:hypothetical protein